MPGSPDLAGRRDALDRRERDFLSPRACPSLAARRRRPDPQVEAGHRQNFQVDADRILHSLAYTRYIDKTQVFYLVQNEDVSHRVLHVQLVSKISRTVGRLLGLNEDLIEAIALGHDLGHAPFGHDGEDYLSALGQAHGLPPFRHSLQSVRDLDVLERKGVGWNLSLQVLDGILCHDGEMDQMGLRPDPDKDFDRLGKEVAAKERNPGLNLRPMTAEGCVVRLCDTIAYVGRDVEDAIRLGLIRREELPVEAVEVLGRTNGTIVFRLVENLIGHSLSGPAVGFSAPVAEALLALKDFNRRRIYLNPRIKVQAAKIENLFNILFESALDDLARGRRDQPIFTDFLAQMSGDYAETTPPALQVRDFLAGLTDAQFLRWAQARLIPQPILGPP